MAREEISASVGAFISENIRNVTQIEILALILDSPEQEWTARLVDQTLRSNEPYIARQLADFVGAGILVNLGGPDIAYRYQPRTEALAVAAAETIKAYRTRSVLVIETIFKRNDPAHSFAEAFRIRPQ